MSNLGIFRITPSPPKAFAMSKKRGLSLEQKRKKMLPIFYESQDFYLLKELEKMGPRKGVISQSVKDFVQSLVDDDLLRNVSCKIDSDLESNERVEAIADLKAIGQKHNELKDELAKYKNNDLAAFEAMKEAIVIALALANEWTGSTFLPQRGKFVG
ncbi:Meiotic nuclear division protein 1 [Glycine soja]